MTHDPYVLRDLLLARLVEQLGELSPHSNPERVTADLALVRWAAERPDHVGITAQDRRQVAEAVQRLNSLVFGGPDAPDAATFPGDQISVKRSMAELSAAARRWLSQVDAPALKLRIHTVGGTHEVELADLLTIQVAAGERPLYDILVLGNSPAIQVCTLPTGAGLLIRPLGSTSVELRNAGPETE